jgi:hypothetical protein
MTIGNIGLNFRIQSQAINSNRRTVTEEFRLPAIDAIDGTNQTNYDFTNSTQKEVRELSGNLFGSGKINLIEAGILNNSVGPLWSAVGGPSAVEGREVNVKFDVISSLKSQIETAKQYSPASSVAVLEVLLAKVQSSQGNSI